MNLLEGVRIALAMIRTNKLRATFTVLGTVVGVTFLIAVITLIEGMNAYVEKEFKGAIYGVNTVLVRRFPAVNVNVESSQWRDWVRRPRLTLDDERKRLERLRDRLIDGIAAMVPDALLSGPRDRRLPNNVHFCFAGIEGEGIILRLDHHGICAATGSACTSATLDPSHVLLAMGRPHEIAHGSLRLTLGRSTSDADVDRVLGVLPKVIGQLRAMSPLYQPGAYGGGPGGCSR